MRSVNQIDRLSNDAVLLPQPQRQINDANNPFVKVQIYLRLGAGARMIKTQCLG